MKLKGKAKVLKGKPVLLLILPTKVPHGLAWYKHF
jgi:hypothetical protein